MNDSLKVTTPSDREIAMTRVFDAPRQLIFEAYTKPALLKRWLGVQNGWTLDVCEVDLRVGGSYRYVWRKGDIEMGMGGVYTEIVPPERVVATERFDQSCYAEKRLPRSGWTEQNGRIDTHHDGATMSDARRSLEIADGKRRERRIQQARGLPGHDGQGLKTNLDFIPGSLR